MKLIPVFSVRSDELPEDVVRDLEQKKKEKRSKATSKLTVSHLNLIFQSALSEPN